MEKTTLIIYPESGDTVYNLVADTGEHLASHMCSSWHFAEGDLEANRPERQKEWKEKFGEYEVKFLSETDISEEELLRRNKVWYESLPKGEEETTTID